MNQTEAKSRIAAIANAAMRNHYAGLAMQGMVSSIHNEEGYKRLRAMAEAEGLTVSQWIARDSFKQADAMVSASEQQNELERITAERDALAHSVLTWWDAHQHDTPELIQAGGNVYVHPEEPEFVTLALATGVEP